MKLFGSVREKDTVCARTNVVEAKGIGPLTWLLYVGFWIIQPAYQRQLKPWLFLAAALLAFLPLYFGAVYGKLLTRRLCTLGTLVLALIYVPVNQSAFGIYFYIAWDLVNLVESDAAVVRLMALECGVIALQAWVFQLESWEWTIGVAVTTLSVINAIRLRQKERGNAKLRVAREEIELLAKTAERERIARDLHDLLGHTLSLIVIKSELAGKLFAAQPERAAVELADIEQIARRALAEVRETVTGYRTRGLGEEMEEAANTLQAAGVHPVVPRTAPRLHAQHEAALALVLREAVTNVVRHADASTCRVELAAGPASTVLIVADDGRGGIEREGNGLRGMRERIRELGGSLTLHSADGTRLEVALPVQP